MGFESVLKVGGKAFIQAANKAYVKPMRKVQTLESLDLKMEPLMDKIADNVVFGKIKKLKDCVSVEPNDFIEVYPNMFRTNYRYINSKAAKSFKPFINEQTLNKGLSTKPNIGGVSLIGRYDQPIGTSGVGDCAVIFMYDSKKNIHSFYHSYSFTSIDEIRSNLSKIMPEGFDRIIIVPGSNPNTAKTASNLFAAAKDINKDAIVEFKHSDVMLEQAKRYEDITGAPRTVEFISYCGDVYVMPISEKYVPLFKIST